MGELFWDSTTDVEIDSTMVFGRGYDFWALENLRQEAVGKCGFYLIWPNAGKWSLYRDTDGAFRSDLLSQDIAKTTAEKWDTENIRKVKHGKD